jgi:hypothetical protein
MKRLSAILLLGIFSFNLFGYRLIAVFLENQENRKMELAIEKNDYSDSELMAIRVPTNLPYYTNSPTFQRIDGEIEVEGVYYKYVKSRIYNDSLELLCIPNTAKTKIQAAKADFSKLASEFQQSNNKKKSTQDAKSFQKTISEYEEQPSATAYMATAPQAAYLQQNNTFVNSLFLKTAEQPPDAA